MMRAGMLHAIERYCKDHQLADVRKFGDFFSLYAKAPNGKMSSVEVN